MFCKQCGKEVDSNSVFCNHCGAQLNSVSTNNESVDNIPNSSSESSSGSNDNSKLYKILSYIGFLWLIGLLVKPEKEKKDVKFHVGQGIILTIFSVALPIVVSIVNKILLAIGFSSWSMLGIMSIICTLLTLASWGLVITLAIIGLVNVCKNQDKPLPIIGRFAFYK